MFSSLRILASSLVLVVVVFASAFVPANAQAQDELPTDLEERAHFLYEQVMCPRCSGQTLDQSQAPIAKAMRAVIRDQLRGGATNDQIIELLVGSYGESILASPPTQGFSLTAWLVPPASLLIGAAVVAFAVRSMRRQPAINPVRLETSTASPPSDLQKYLALVDEELGNDSARRER